MNKVEKTQVVVEKSRHEHTMKASEGMLVSEIMPSVLKIKVKGKGIVTHGEHGTICTESQDVMKYTQQEYNPVTRAMQNAFD